LLLNGQSSAGERKSNVKLRDFYCIKVGNENFNVSVPISGIPMNIFQAEIYNSNDVFTPIFALVE